MTVASPRTVPSNCGGGGGEVEGQSGQLPSFLLIKDTPNCIEEIFGTLINRMIMMDELMLALCLGPSDTEERFINSYTCHLPARVHRTRMTEGD